MIGTRTNIVTGVEVTGSNVNDSPVLPDLLNASAKRFTMERVSADKGYLSNSNVDAIVAHGAEPFIPFKSNSRYGVMPDASRRKSDVWHKMFHYYRFRKDEFLRHYHRRSNVETDVSHDQGQVR
jgi:hypothetical protein